MRDPRAPSPTRVSAGHGSALPRPSQHDSIRTPCTTNPATLHSVVILSLLLFIVLLCSTTALIPLRLLHIPPRFRTEQTLYLPQSPQIQPRACKNNREVEKDIRPYSSLAFTTNHSPMRSSTPYLHKMPKSRHTCLGNTLKLAANAVPSEY